VFWCHHWADQPPFVQLLIAVTPFSVQINTDSQSEFKMEVHDKLSKRLENWQQIRIQQQNIHIRHLYITKTFWQITTLQHSYRSKWI
jgi:hypothetical protein